MTKLLYTFKNQASFFAMMPVGGGSPLGAKEGLRWQKVYRNLKNDHE